MFLEDYATQIRYQGFLRDLRQGYHEHVDIPIWDETRKLLDELRCVNTQDVHIDLNDCIEITQSKLDAHSIERISRSLIPWRTGPFRINDLFIDSEWKSHLKWQRILDWIPDLTNARVADVGCSNGYFLFRLLKKNPRLLLGLDPSGRCYYQFHFIQHFIRDPRLEFLPLGAEQLEHFPEFFDFILCMGVIYHRRDPYTFLRLIREALRSNGSLIIESIVHPSSGNFALCPTDRYLKMRNVWFVPTTDCLVVWLKRAGFTRIEVICETEISHQEQRQTFFAPFESLPDFLDPNDPSLTIEGFESPKRVSIRAQV